MTSAGMLFVQVLLLMKAVLGLYFDLLDCTSKMSKSGFKFPILFVSFSICVTDKKLHARVFSEVGPWRNIFFFPVRIAPV